MSHFLKAMLSIGAMLLVAASPAQVGWNPPRKDVYDLKTMEKCAYFYMHATGTYQAVLQQKGKKAFKTKSALLQDELFVNYSMAFKHTAKLVTFLKIRAVELDDDDLYDEAAAVIEAPSANEAIAVNGICEQYSQQAWDGLTIAQQKQLETRYTESKLTTLVWESLGDTSNSKKSSKK